MKTLKRERRRSDPATFDKGVIFTPTIVGESQLDLPFGQMCPTTYVLDYTTESKSVSPVDKGRSVPVMDRKFPAIPGFEGKVVGFNSQHIFSMRMHYDGEEGISMAQFCRRADLHAQTHALVQVDAQMLAALRTRPSGIPEWLLDGRVYFAQGTVIQSESRYYPDKWVPYMYWCDSPGHSDLFGDRAGMNFTAGPFRIFEDMSAYRHQALFIPRGDLHVFDKWELAKVLEGEYEVA